MAKTLQEMKDKWADRLGVDIVCDCGRTHRADIEAVLLGSGAVQYIPELMEEHRYQKAMILADPNTWDVAGNTVYTLLQDHGYQVYPYIYERESGVLVADEFAIEEGCAAFRALPETPDVIITVGTGSLNDLGKVIAHDVNSISWCVGTAPSMDGYASTVAALTRENLKVTEYYNPPAVIIGDTDIMKTAPREMVLAGIADMAGKYNARLDWRLSRLINDEYYCPFIADGMLKVTDDIMDLALEVPEDGTFSDELLERLMEGLVLSGVYMSYTGTSRAASGCEHHFSHFWEMWLQVNGKPPIYHGVKVGVGSVTMAELYPRFLDFEIDREKALAAIDAFDEEAYIETLKEVYKEAAPGILADYSFEAETRKKRLDKAIEKREEIDKEIRMMLPRLEKLLKAMDHLKARTRWYQLDNISEVEARQAMRHCKVMRPQYTILQMMQDTAYPLEVFEEEWVKRESEIIKEDMDMEELLQNAEAAEVEEMVEAIVEEAVTEAVEEALAEVAEEAVEETVEEAAPVEAAPEAVVEEKPAPKKRGRKPGSKNKKPAAKKVEEKPAPKKRGRKSNAEKAAEAAKAEAEKEAVKPVEVPKKKKKQDLPYYLL